MRLLLVEDDADDVELTRLAFAQHGFEPELLVARDGIEALELLAADGAAGRPLPSLIVTDLKMPRMDGIELLTRLKEDPKLRRIPVAVFTSSGYDADMQEALRLGALQYLRKPADLDEYAEVAGRLAALAGLGPS